MRTQEYYNVLDSDQQSRADKYLNMITPMAEMVVNKTPEKQDKKSILSKILLEQKYRVREDLKSFENAILDKDNVVNYNRELIHRIYKKTIQDAHVRSQWTTRKLKTLKKDFQVFPKRSDEPNEELTELLQSPWFYKFVDFALDSIAWGYSLIEFGIWKDGSFHSYRTSNGGLMHEDIIIAERDNVKPELGVVTSIVGANHGVDFNEDKFKKQLIFVGGSTDGWLYDAAKPYLIKDNVLKNWSEFAELFGMDMRFMRTDSEGQERKDLEQSLKAAVGGGSLLAGLDDQLEYIGTGRTDSFKVFKELVDTMDKTLSKLIFGQDVISNNTGRVVGEVGESVANVYADADARFIKYIIEDKLFPLMILNGVPFEGMEFKWGTRENLSLVQRADIDLKITQMGFGHSPEYINETYDVNVEDESTPIEETNNKLKALYQDAT